MALIPSTTFYAPSPEQTNIGTPVYGATVSKIADQTNHLAFAKAKRHQIGVVNVSSTHTWSANKQNFDVTPYSLDMVPVDAGSRSYTQIIQTTANARYLGLIFAYRTHENGDRSITLTAFRNPRTTQDIIDNGFILSVANGGIISTYDPDASDNFWNQASVSSGIDMSSTSTLQTIYPRPIFIPLDYRGQEIGLKFDCVRVRLDNICIYEMFDEVIND